MSDVASLGRDALRTMWTHKRDIGGVILLALLGLALLGALASRLNDLLIDRFYPGGLDAFALAPYTADNSPYHAGLPLTGLIITLLMIYWLCLYAARRLLPGQIVAGSFPRFVLFVVTSFVIGCTGLFPTALVWVLIAARTFLGPYWGESRIFPALAVLSLVLARFFVLPFLAAVGTRQALIDYWENSKGRYFWLVREFGIVVFVLAMPAFWIPGWIEAAMPLGWTSSVTWLVLFEMKATYLIFLYVAVCSHVLLRLRSKTDLSSDPQPTST